MDYCKRAEIQNINAVVERKDVNVGQKRAFAVKQLRYQKFSI